MWTKWLGKNYHLASFIFLLVFFPFLFVCLLLAIRLPRVLLKFLPNLNLLWASQRYFHCLFITQLSSENSVVELLDIAFKKQQVIKDINFYHCNIKLVKGCNMSVTFQVNMSNSKNYYHIFIFVFLLQYTWINVLTNDCTDVPQLSFQDRLKIANEMHENKTVSYAYRKWFEFQS